jgi:hypothetical protein
VFRSRAVADWSPIGNQHTDRYQAAIDARLGASTSLEQFAERAQFVNYENHRAMFGCSHGVQVSAEAYNAA